MTLATLYELPKEVAKLTDVDEPTDLSAIEAGYEAYLAEVADAERVAAMERDLLRFGKAVKALEGDREPVVNLRNAAALKVESIDNRIAWLKSWMLNLMQQTGIEKVKDPLVSVYTQANNASIEVDDFDAVPVEWKRATLVLPLADVPPELGGRAGNIEVTKQALLAHIKETGEVIEGVTVVTDRRHVRVR